MAVKFLLLCLVFAAYILDIETLEVVMVPRGVGGGNSNFLIIGLIITGITGLVLTCSVIQCCCSKCFPDKNNIQAERAMLFAYLRALHYNKQSTADGQIGPCEQMGSSQLKLDTLSQMTLNNADDSKEPTATSDIESRPWEQVGSPQLKLDTRIETRRKRVRVR
uniref:Uncharacterized protein n=1 Tax=Magallana gigas TaxID=29159 RepID=K1QNH6_MAGGI